ncbi:MAG TPA: efflux RND transporter periplasmic adaptor subunit [Burkholderiales bacterium]|nr:efflux RND transporter periplasmic adaptor subunit [Burkholderiales bacterium]
MTKPGLRFRALQSGSKPTGPSRRARSRRPGPRVALRAALLSVPLLALLGGCEKAPERVEIVRPVQAVAVALSADQQEVTYTGDVRARWETALGFRVPGKIVARRVEVGQQVKKGQILASLDPGDQRLSAEAAKQQLLAARSDYQQAKADLVRYKELVDKGFVSAAEFDRRKTTYQTTAAKLEEATAQLELNRNQTAYTTLRADHDGVVTAVQAEVGQVVSAGQAVVKTARLDEMEVAVNVPENRLAELRAAREVDVSLWAAPGRTYKGRIREISPSADNVTRTYTVKVTLLDPDPSVQLGMTANVFLRGAAQAQVARLPLTALFQKGNEPAVWMIDRGTGQVTLKPVQVGRYTQDYVTVVSGLNDGDLVVRAGVHKLHSGEKVRILTEPAQ